MALEPARLGRGGDGALWRSIAADLAGTPAWSALVEECAAWGYDPLRW